MDVEKNDFPIIFSIYYYVCLVRNYDSFGIRNKYFIQTPEIKNQL
jgi:hypothetical protein